MTLVEQYRTLPERVCAKANSERARRDPVSKWAVIGWIIPLAGPILWLWLFLVWQSCPDRLVLDGSTVDCTVSSEYRM